MDHALDRLIPAAATHPGTIHAAMRYSLFAGGKRIRPLLAIAAAEALGTEAGAELPGCAVECVHAYSLIHDDLPALDNDDFRRGRPTCHKVYGEAMAILAGDALLTAAFKILAELDPAAENRAAMIAELAAAAGSVEGMIGGQVADLEAEGKSVTAERLHYIHRAKTGALIRASVRLGALSATPRRTLIERSANTDGTSAWPFRLSTTCSMSCPRARSWARPPAKTSSRGRRRSPRFTGLRNRAAGRESASTPRWPRLRILERRLGVCAGLPSASCRARTERRLIRCRIRLRPGKVLWPAP